MVLNVFSERINLFLEKISSSGIPDPAIKVKLISKEFLKSRFPFALALLSYKTMRIQQGNNRNPIQTRMFSVRRTGLDSKPLPSSLRPISAKVLH